MIRQILGAKLSVFQLLILGLVFGGPYVLVGVIWALGHTEHLQGLGLIDKGASFGAQVALWPLLMVADVKLP